MAGFFGFFDYTKPGPGVPNPEDAPKKARIIIFLEILQRKFWNLVKINLMFNIFNLPAVLLGMLAVTIFLFPVIIPGAVNDPDLLVSDILLKFVLLSVFLCIPLITVGPAQAGFTYILRNYSREEHAFLWDDFKENALKNFRQSLFISAIDFFVAILMVWSIKAYIILGGENIIMTIGTTLMCMMFVIYIIMHMYIYPMIVTFNLTIRQAYKNALIFSIIKLLPNLGILLLCTFIVFLTFGMIIPFNPIIGVILYAFITVSLIGMITNFYVYPKLMKYIVREEKNTEDEQDEETEELEEDREGSGDETGEIGRDAENSEDGSDGEKRYF